MSITSNFPALKPTLLLDFANVKQLDPRITFTRASTATYYGTQTAKAEENLLLQSQDFTTTWTNVGTTDTANTSVAPDGTTTADTLTENPSGSGLASISQTLNFIAGLPYTLSFFVKQGTQTFAQLLFSSGAFGVNAYANFNVTTGAGAVGTVGSSTTASIVDAGNGWYRCVITATATITTSSTVQLLIIESATDARAPSITLDSGTILLWGAQLEQRSAVTAYTPTTTQFITNYIPVLETAASGVARFDHNPTTFESLGLLIEESRTNLVLQSENFATTWTTLGATISTNVIVAPSGTLTGDQIIEDTSVGSGHRVNQSISADSTGTYTGTCYVKAAGRTWARFLLDDNSGNSCLGWFDLSTGVVGSATNNGTATLASVNIVSVGNGWFRCSLTGKPSTSNSATVRFQVATTINNLISTHTGDGYSGLYIWGAQLEAGAFATSYIPTVASQVTRAADAASMTGTNFSSWYNNTQGTLYSEASSYDVSSTGRTGFSITDASNNNRIQVNHGSTKIFIAKGGITQLTSTIANATVSNNVASKIALAYTSNNGNGTANGVIAGVDDTVVEVPVVTQVNIGNLQSGAANTLNGQIRKIAYYPIRLTNTQLQALTS